MINFKLCIVFVFLSLQLTGFSQKSDTLNSLFIHERYDHFIKKALTEIQSESADPELFYLLGKSYFELSRYDSALYFFKLSLKTDSNNLRTLSATGQTFSTMGRYNEAIRVYNSIFQVDSSNYFYYKQLGRCYQELGDTDLAIKSYLKAFNLNNYDLGIVSRLINLYLKKKDFTNGIELANKGLSIDSMNIELRKQRAYLFFLTEQYHQAIFDFQQAKVAGDSSQFTFKYQGLCYYEEKLYPDACKDLFEAYTRDTLDAETCFFLGLSYRWSGEEEKGVEYLNKTLTLLKPDPRQISRIYIELAGVYQVLHQFDMTINSYEEALEFSENKDLIYFKLAQVYDYNLNDKKRAIEYYQKYIDNKLGDYQLYDNSSEAMQPVLENAQERINRLKEDLFFEE